MPQVRVVLVRPETPSNIGASARAIRNTGLAGLDLVSPGDWRTVECWRTAWGAHEVLEEARVYPDLAAALSGVHLTVALSGRGERSVPLADVRDVAQEAATLAADDRVALVFGPETTGLNLDELALCGRRARIPSHPAQPSLNLSHAVMVAAYEVFRCGVRPGNAPRRATHDERERMLGLLRDGLRAIKATPDAKSRGYLRELRALVQRADLTPREVHLLEHMARKMTQVGRGRPHLPAES